MTPRARFARFLLQAGRLVQSLAVAVMRPDDLTSFSRHLYRRPENTSSFSDPSYLEEGLTPPEKKMTEDLHAQRGRLLLLGVGGGREAIPLSERGYRVTGVDFSPEMLQAAADAARRRGVSVETLCGDIATMAFGENRYAVVWLSALLYSSVPGRSRRIAMLQRLCKAMKTDGSLVCSFYYRPDSTYHPVSEMVRRVVARTSGGNPEYQKGDLLWQNREFLHAFSSRDEVEDEFDAGGLIVSRWLISDDMPEGWALLEKR